MTKEKQKVDVNMNAQVKFLLTEYGREVYKKHYEDLNCLKHMPNPAEEIKMSLWEMANIFGQVLYMGNTKIPFVDNQIEMLFNINEEKEIINCIN